MRLGLCSHVAVGAFALAVAIPAHAQYRLGIDQELGKTNGWTVGFNESLSGCVASSQFSDRTTIWIGVNGNDNSFYLAFTNPRWNSISSGKDYALQLQAVNAGRYRGTFVGVEHENEKGLVATRLKEKFVADLMRSPGLAIAFSDRPVAKIALQGSVSAVDSVLECQKQNRDGSPRSASRGSKPSTSSGTGFFITRAGHVLTNNHVVRECNNITVHKDGDSFPGKTIANDAKNDLALISTSRKPQAVASFRTSVKLGENISVFGYPLSGILSAGGNFTVGHVTALTGLDDDSSTLQISAPVHPGNSGGPTMDRSGNVVGVIVSTINHRKLASAIDVNAQNINFAIKSQIASNFLDANGLRYDAQPASEILDTADVAEKAKSFTVKITCTQ